MPCALDIIAVSGKVPSWVQSGCEEYLRRLPSTVAVRFIPVPAVKRTRGLTAAVAMRQEGRLLRQAMAERSHLIVLDEKGRRVSSRQMADHMRRWLEDNQRVAFMIGGADGLSDDLAAQAAEVWSLSALTLPHALARLVLTEQLYRSWSLLQGHPYHRG